MLLIGLIVGMLIIKKRVIKPELFLYFISPKTSTFLGEGEESSFSYYVTFLNFEENR